MTRRHMLAALACAAVVKPKPAAPQITPEGLQELMGSLKAMYRNPHWIDVAQIEKNARSQDVFPWEEVIRRKT